MTNQLFCCIRIIELPMIELLHCSSFSRGKLLSLKELWNCISCIICVRSLFCSVPVYKSLDFLPILFVKLDFDLSVFVWFFVFLYLWILVFSFSVLCLDSNFISKDVKVQSRKLYNNKYMIASTQTNPKIFTFIAIPVLKLLSCKVLFINRNDNRIC